MEPDKDKQQEMKQHISEEFKGVTAHLTKRHEEFVAEQKKDLDGQREAWKKHEESLIAIGAKADEVRTMTERALKLIDGVEARLAAPGGQEQQTQDVLAGERFVKCESWQNYAKRGWHQGGTSLHFGGKNSPDELKQVTLFDGHPLFTPVSGRKTTIDTTAIGSSTPGILIPQRVGGVAFEGVRRLRVRDLLRRIPTTNNAVEWVKTNTITHGASPQTEASDKAESAYTFVIDSSPVRTLAHWIPATRQVLDDTGFLTDAINFELLKGLADQEDAELLTGSGTGLHISGLITEATAYSFGGSTTGDNKMDTLNHALLQLEQLERTATGIVLNPADWRAITVTKTNDPSAGLGIYLLGGPGGVTAPTLWGVPVAVTTAMTSGKMLVGDFDAGAFVADRMEARIDVSTEHSDFFIKNMVAIRAEERLALIVRRADYFVYGTI